MLFHSGRLSVQCEEDWKPPQQNVSTSRKQTNKRSMFCCEREIPMEWNPLQDISISLLSFRKQRHCMSRFCYFRKKELCRVWMKCKKDARDHLVCFCFSLSGGKISCHLTGCILQIFSVVDIDVNTNFYLNTLDSGSLIIFWLWLQLTRSVNISHFIALTNHPVDQTKLMKTGLLREANEGFIHSHF